MQHFYFRGLLGLCLLAAFLLALPSCSNPQASNEAVAGSVLNQLRQQTSEMSALGMTRRGDMASFSASWDAPEVVRVPMLRVHDLPAVACYINGRDAVPVIVDSGSQGCVLEASTAVAKHVRIVNPSEARFTLSGIAGTEFALMGLPDLVTIGEWKLSRFPVLVRTHQSHVSTGIPFFQRRFHFNVWGMDPIHRLCSYLTLDYPKSEVSFGFGKTYHPEHKLSWRSPLKFKMGLPVVRLRSGGHSWDAIVDTGASSLLEIDDATATRLHLHQKAQPAEATRVGVGGGGGEGKVVMTEMAQLPKLEGLGPEMENIDALLVSDYSKVGTGLLSAFRITLDFSRGEIWLEDVRT